jgi:hypothetical protein
LTAEGWLAGAAGPHEQLVARVHAQVEAFRARGGADEAVVEVELRDGPRVALQSISSDPGFGFVTLRPHGADDGDGEDIGPDEEWIVPVAAIARIRLRHAEAEHERFGFSLPEPDA